MRALADVPAELRFAPRVGTYREANKSKKLFEDFGYHHIRSSYHMLIEMEAPVPEPQFPEGVILRTFNPETDLEAVYQADQDSFRDHFGFVDQPFRRRLESLQAFQIDA